MDTPPTGNENDEVCVTFVVRGSDPETIARIQRLIRIRQANGDALVEGQTRLAEYEAFTPSAEDTGLLDDLQKERARVTQLEDRIADVERAGRVRAKEALQLAEQRRVNLRQELEEQYNVLAEHDKQLRELTEKYEYYAEIRDRCIKVRILQEIATGDEEALATRLKVLSERIRHFTKDCAEVDELIEGCKTELDQTVADVQLPRKEVEAERFGAQQQLHRLHTHIAEQEEVLDRQFQDNEAEINALIEKHLDDANMSKRTRNDRLQKLKIQALSLASTLSEHEFRGNALAQTKKKLVHDFGILQALRSKFTEEQNRELVELQRDIAGYQSKLKDLRVAFGENTAERMEAFEAEVRAEQSREWLARITALREAHRQDLLRAGEQFKASVEENSKRMGKLYADTIQREVLQFEDHKAVEVKRSEALIAKLKKLETRGTRVREQLEQKREETEAERQRVKDQRERKAARLQELKHSVHATLRARHSPQEAVGLLRRAVQMYGPSPRILAACRKEVQRVTFVREMMPAVIRHFDGVEYFQRLKQSGLEATKSSADLDHLAISLCNAGIILEQNAKELLQRLDAYRTRFGAEFHYRGHVVRDHLARVQELLQSGGSSGSSPQRRRAGKRRPGEEGEEEEKKEGDDGLPVLVDEATMQDRSPDRNAALRRAEAAANRTPPGSNSNSNSNSGSNDGDAGGVRRGIYFFNDLEQTVGSLGYTRPDRMFEDGDARVGRELPQQRRGGKHNQNQHQVSKQKQKHKKQRMPAMGLNRRDSVRYGTS